jgi:hypothetical protein
MKNPGGGIRFEPGEESDLLKNSGNPAENSGRFRIKNGESIRLFVLIVQQIVKWACSKTRLLQVKEGVGLALQVRVAPRGLGTLTSPGSPGVLEQAQITIFFYNLLKSSLFCDIFYIILRMVNSLNLTRFS